MEELFEFLTQYKTGFLSTVDANGYPHVRVVGLQCIKDNMLVYATAKTKPMYEQMQNCSHVELAVSKPDYSLNVRVSGEAALCDEMELKKEIIQNSPSLTRLYGSADNPAFTLFCIKPLKARYWSFTEDRTVAIYKS